MYLASSTFYELHCLTHRLGSKVPAFLKTSAKTGTVELTGFEMTQTNAFGQFSVMAFARSAQMPALIYFARIAKAHAVSISSLLF